MNLGVQLFFCHLEARKNGWEFFPAVSGENVAKALSPKKLFQPCLVVVQFENCRPSAAKAVIDFAALTVRLKTLALRTPVNELYKKGCQEKTSPSTGGREDLCLEIQPTVCERAPRFARRVMLWLVCHSLGFIFRWSPRQSSLETWQADLVFECQPWFYPRLVAYRYFWLSEEA